jgi:hypothetical protein
MTTEEYQNAIIAVSMCASILVQYDLPQLLADIATADTIGPLFDPTLWMKKNGAMYEDKELLEAALPLFLLAKKSQANSEHGQTP